MKGAAPVLHVVVTDPVPSRGADKLVTMGSYAPNATAAVLMVQVAVMLEVTLRSAGAVAAVESREVANRARAETARNERFTRMCI
jgi:ribosomal protein S16